MTRFLLPLLMVLWVSQPLGAEAKIHRSAGAVAAFKRANPCPSNGATKGPCPGYVVDHIKPLACAGADQPANMQWQTKEDALAKDKWERKGCKR